MAAACETPPTATKPSAKKLKKYEQKFRNEWLHQSEFKDWLAGPSSSYVDPRCFVTCNKTVACHRSGLIKHANSQSHVSLMKSRNGVSSVKALFKQEAQRHCYKETTELQLASFIAEHNLPFTLLVSMQIDEKTYEWLKILIDS